MRGSENSPFFIFPFMKEGLRIVFMGTPEFAADSLDILYRNGYNIVAVVTAPDKPAGRGRKLQTPAVKDYAAGKGIPVLQPENLKDPEFNQILKDMEPDLQVVVAFRMLPRIVWALPPKGTFNLHASLLPQYRGAAPMNWAIINGEKETGLTTFFLNENIDTGDIIFREKVDIGAFETLGELHDRMKEAGAKLVLKTVKAIEQDALSTYKQELLAIEPVNLKPAPKISRDDCRINWKDPSEDIFNRIRGLSPVPGAFTEIAESNGFRTILKIYRADFRKMEHNERPGTIHTDGETFFRIYTSDGWIDAEEVQMAGKRKMNVKEFLKGYRHTPGIFAE